MAILTSVQMTRKASLKLLKENSKMKTTRLNISHRLLGKDDRLNTCIYFYSLLKNHYDR